jgi:mannose-1-phosphate guanylyltransferase
LLKLQWTGSNTLENKSSSIGRTRVLLLAAGHGTRLRPFTDEWPKCLMPVQKRALLEIWLDGLREIGVETALVNLHAHSDKVREFLQRPKYQSWVKNVYEKDLLGTAGTVRANLDYLGSETTFLAHADNLCICNFKDFFDFHYHRRPQGTVMTMMTFATETPKSCGIVELDGSGIVRKFHEKVSNPPGNKANAAIYLLDAAVLNWIRERPEITDFSNEVIPHFLGKIATWHNNGVMRDIGTPEALRAAQKDVQFSLPDVSDEWAKMYAEAPIQRAVISGAP